MSKEFHEWLSSSKNKSGWKVMSFIKKASAPLIAAALMASCSSSNSEQNNIQSIQIWKWATLSSIVKDSLWLDSTLTSDPKLCRILIDNIAEQNNIKDVNTIRLNDTLIVNMDSIKNVIEKYQSDSLWIPANWTSTKDKGIAGSKEKGKQWKSLDKNLEGETKYITIHSVEEFNSSNAHLVKKLREDKSKYSIIINNLKKWYSIKFLNQIETKNSPSLSVDEITKPKEILWNELKGKKFVLDPWHWSVDIWLPWLANYWPKENKEKIIVYESALMMDLTYRVARELRAHWAEVHLTHYMNRRWIMDTKDLPPCSMVYDQNWNETYQDIWDWDNKDLVGQVFWITKKWKDWKNHGDWSLEKRATIANKYNPDLYVSFHIDYPWNDKLKLLDILYSNLQKNKKKSKEIWEKLFNNWFWYYYNWKLNEWVSRWIKLRKKWLWALNWSKSPAILIETWNAYNESQAYILREYTKRDELAKNFVSSLIKVYKK